MELVFLMMAAAAVIHFYMYWSYRFSKSESYWAGAELAAHQAVDHKICLEDVKLDANNRVVLIPDKEKICAGL